jgi:hypothetical protein
VPQLELPAREPSSPIPPSHRASPALLQTPLNPLHDPKDGKFLALPSHIAGRQVCIVLFARGNSRESRERAWREKMGEGVKMEKLGIAAQAIEDAGYNWRELTSSDDVLTAAESLLGEKLH